MWLPPYILGREVGLGLVVEGGHAGQRLEHGEGCHGTYTQHHPYTQQHRKSSTYTQHRKSGRVPITHEATHFTHRLFICSIVVDGGGGVSRTLYTSVHLYTTMLPPRLSSTHMPVSNPHGRLTLQHLVHGGGVAPELLQVLGAHHLRHDAQLVPLGGHSGHKRSQEVHDGTHGVTTTNIPRPPPRRRATYHPPPTTTVPPPPRESHLPATSYRLTCRMRWAILRYSSVSSTSTCARPPGDEVHHHPPIMHAASTARQPSNTNKRM